MKKDKEKVLIIGAGMAGLTAGAYLSRENYEVIILEKSERVGGLVSTFCRKGFSFDTGPRAFVNSGMVLPILKDLDIEIDTLDNDISIAINDYIFQVESIESIREYENILLKLYPKNNDDVYKIIKNIRSLSENTKVLYEFDNPYFVDYMSDKKFVVKKMLPWLIKLLFALKKFKKYGMPMEEFLEKQTNNRSLIDILTQFFFKNTPTYFALGYFYVWLDYFYPKGGTGVLPNLLNAKFIKGGGEIKFNTKVVEVDVLNKKVLDKNNNFYEYDHLIWAADLKTLYKNLNTKGIDKEIVYNINEKAKVIKAAKTAESSFIMYAAINRPPSYFKERGGAHVFYTDSKNGLGETNRKIKNTIIDEFDKMTKEEVLNWLKDFCDLNTYEISIPVLRDSMLAPEGKTGIMVSCLFDYSITKKISDAGWINEFQKAFEDNILKLLSKSFYLDLDKDVIFKFSSTPITINKSVGSSNGAIVGWSFETKSPVFDSLKDMPKSAKTPIPNIYQAGQWAYAPAGVPIAMLTGWHATQEIIKKAKK